MIILGIDPGTARTGFGVVRKIQDSLDPRGTPRRVASKNRNKIECLDYGLIQTSPDLEKGERLKKINNEVGKLIRKYKPDLMAIESLYFFKNLKTALPVSRAEGVILLAAAKNKVPVLEFTPLQVKMAMVGYGRAEKKQIQEIVKFLLNLKEIPEPDDSADALALAICGANFSKR